MDIPQILIRLNDTTITFKPGDTIDFGEHGLIEHSADNDLDNG